MLQLQLAAANIYKLQVASTAAQNQLRINLLVFGESRIVETIFAHQFQLIDDHA